MIFGRRHVVACRCESGPGAVLLTSRSWDGSAPSWYSSANSPPTAAGSSRMHARLRAPRHRSGVVRGLHRIDLYELTGGRSVMVYVGLPFA